MEGYEEHTETYEITFSYVDAKTKVIEVVKEIQNKKLPQTPEKPEDVKTGDKKYHAPAANRYCSSSGLWYWYCPLADQTHKEIKSIWR